ncbi:MAG: hypothetical protein GY790_09725 [Bacteroidetes bacterium]|nr:hypothetical protein [Bacteroidota bacterium]
MRLNYSFGKFGLYLILLAGFLFGCNSGGEILYVASDGSDLNAGTLSSPFATITKARNVIREENIQGKSRSYRVILREGTYYLPSTFILSPEDSGKEGKTIVYTNYRDEKVSISGALRLKCQWQLHENGVYKCSLPEQSGLKFSQLFVNGKRQVRARYPNGNSLLPDKEAYIFPIKADQWPHEKIYFDPRTFSEKRWENPRESILHIFPNHHWGNLQYKITGVNYEESSIQFEQRDPQINETYFKMMERPGTWLSDRSNFFIDNVLEELDVEGEWYFDRNDKQLFYMPHDTIDLETAVVEVPVLKELISIKGSMEDPVKNIRFENIRFTGSSTSYMERYEYPSLGDWGIVRSGAVLLEGVEGCAIEDCFFDAAGGNAIFINKYAHEVEITGNLFTECGESAVCLVGKSHLNFDKSYQCNYCGAEHPWGWEKPSEEIPSACLIHNNLIHDIGVFGKQVAGVFLSLSKEISISHNHIFNTPRAAICFNDGWHGGHYVEFNDVHHTVRETGDHGPFNSWGRERFWCERQSHGQGASHPAGDVLADAKQTTLIRNNRFADNKGWGIDLDDGSSNYHVYNNLCIGVSVKLREGDYRTVENNIFYKGANPPSIHRGYEDNHDVFRKNIVVVDTLKFNPTKDYNFFSGLTSEKVFHFIGTPEQGKWIATLDSNLYFTTSGKFRARVDGGGRNSAAGNNYMNLDEWQNLGFDRHSILADPLFEDPEKGSFKLGPHSPSFDLGFREFPLDQFGLTQEYENIWIE